MAQIADMQDFRGAGPPGDTGIYQMPCSVLVFQFTFSGTTYTAAIRAGDRGWVLVTPASTDASTVIQAAINYLGTDGGLIFFKPALYVLSAGLTIIEDNVHLQGHGWGWERPRLGLDAGIDAHLLTITGKYGCLRNLFFSNNYVANRDVIRLEAAAGWHLQDLIVSGAGRDGVSLTTCNDIMVDTVLSENHARNDFYNYNGYSITFQKCTAWSYGSTGWHGFVVEGGGAGLDVPREISFINCRSGPHARYGMYFYNWDATQGRITVIGGWVHGNIFDGIRILGASRITIIGTQIWDNGLSGDNTYDGIRIASLAIHSTYNKIELCQIFSTGGTRMRYGIYEDNANQDYNSFLGNSFSGLATSGINRAGANTKVAHNIGHVTENVVLSPPFAIDGVATVTVTIPHGLAITPAIQDCSLTVLENTNVDDWGYNLVKVDSVGAVNVVAKVNVSVASATVGATAYLSLRVGKA